MPITFENTAQQFHYERVKRILDAGDAYTYGTEKPFFRFNQGSASVQIWVRTAGEDDAFIRFVSWVVLGAKIDDPALLRYLLDKSIDLVFGSFGVDDAGDICLVHGLRASSCDASAIHKIVASMLATADLFDDAIRARWGGKRFAAPTRVAGPPGFPRITKDPDTGVLYVRDLDVTVDQVRDALRAKDKPTRKALLEALPGVTEQDTAQVSAYLMPYCSPDGIRHLDDTDVAALEPPMW